VTFQGLPQRDGKVRQAVFPKTELDVTALRDDHRGIQSFRDLGAEEPVHLLGGAEVEVRRSEAVSLRVTHGAFGLDAEQDLVPRSILGIKVVGIVGGHQGNTRLSGKAYQGLVCPGLFRNGVVLDLQVKISLAKKVVIKTSPLPSSLFVSLQDQGGDLASQTGGRGNEPPGVSGQQVVVHPGFVIKSVGVGNRDQFYQISISRIVFCQ